MFTMPYVSCITCHMSYVMCHVSRVTCHISCVTCHMSQKKKEKNRKKKKKNLRKSGRASWLRVCYQRGLPRLVFLIVLYCCQDSLHIVLHQASKVDISKPLQIYYVRQGKRPSLDFSIPNFKGSSYKCNISCGNFYINKYAEYQVFSSSQDVLVKAIVVQPAIEIIQYHEKRVGYLQ